MQLCLNSRKRLNKKTNKIICLVLNQEQNVVVIIGLLVSFYSSIIYLNFNLTGFGLVMPK